MSPLILELPIKLESTANLREHWRAKADRLATQKSKVRRRLPTWEGGALLVVRLTRIAPRPLDSDNLASAFKSVRDAIATWLRVDDRTPLVRWDYAQEKGAPKAYAVRVEVLPLGEPHLPTLDEAHQVLAEAGVDEEAFLERARAHVAKVRARRVPLAPDEPLVPPPRATKRELAELATPAYVPPTKKGGGA